MLLRLLIDALWSPAGKGMTCWLLLVMFIDFWYFPMWYPCGILGKVWYLVVLFPDLCHLSHFVNDLICTQYRLGLLHVTFLKFVMEL